MADKSGGITLTPTKVSTGIIRRTYPKFIKENSDQTRISMAITLNNVDQCEQHLKSIASEFGNTSLKTITDRIANTNSISSTNNSNTTITNISNSTNTTNNNSNQPGTPNSDASGATPRKRPRKQLLEPFHLTTSHNIKLLSHHDFKEETLNRGDLTGSVRAICSTGSATTNNNSNNNVNKNSAPGGVITIHKKPCPSILNSYNVPWKSLQYHFLRYSDVKQKPDKKTTLSELSNEGLQRKNGWKVQHLVTHIEDADEEEAELYKRLRTFSDTFDKSEQSIHANVNMLGRTFFNSQKHFIGSQVQLFDKLTDLIRGNLQRSKLFQDQINEGKNLLIKLTNEHKERVGRLTKKCANKRTFINK